MKLRELLSQMTKIAQDIEVAQPYITGGTPRDRFLGHLENISDIDITNGENTINYLSQEFAEKFKQKYNITRKTMDDGHSTIFAGNLKIDFSSNFNVPNIETILKKIGINNPTSIQKEMFSRDFTCNALLLDFDLKTLTDPTEKGFKDLKDKVIRTCLDPKITLTSNRNRVVRSIYLSCKLGFDLDNSIIKFVSENPQSVKISTQKAMSDKLTEAFDRDADRASYLLTKMNLWNYVPILEFMQPYYMKSMNKQAYFQGTEEPTPKKKQYKSDKAIVVQPRFKEPFYRNYDIYDVPGVDGKTNKLGPGAGLYQNMEKYKSVEDFLNKKRKHMKDKYKADDSWIEDTEENKKGRVNKMKTRSHLIEKIIKNSDYMLPPKEHGTNIYNWKNSPYQGIPKAPKHHDSHSIDFPIDDDVTHIIGDTESYYMPNQLGPGLKDTFTFPREPNLGEYEAYSTPIGTGGQGDKYLPMPDFEGKSFDKLDFGRDYTEDDHRVIVNDLINNFLNAAEPDIYGLADGIYPKEDLDAPNNENPQYGETNSESEIYDKDWI